ncbi:hypothetical protein [Chenggangzhangella methanolivorans]|uniref:Uncharacterized protein n=1 Tax=Chenggangzhangella methanolivorans TaxID=1437009 RepID=A0A9E6RCX7_9HYPH|nr:hypothetical protein [Chenggangzhangella methanolivorans]QZO00943.1 hypothetical protein K6K41_04825 [Chenggangzhangella methanolivorans]
MSDVRTPPEPFLSTNIEPHPPHPADKAGAEALRNPPTTLRIVIVLYAIALVAMVVAIAVLKSPGS